MKSKNIFVIAAVVSSMACVNAKALDSASPAQSTKSIMAEFLEHFAALKKHLVSDDAFADLKNADEISSHLKDLAKAVKQTKHDPILNQANFKLSREVLEEHVVETERVFRLGNKSYARWMTNSTLGICMSCHTQVPTQDRKLKDFLKAENFTSDFDQAEFMFATKNFEGAVKLYQKLVASYPKRALSADRLDQCVQRVLLYQVRVQRDLTAAQREVSEFLKNKKLPEYMLQNLRTWQGELTAWSKKKRPSFDKLNVEQIDQEVRKSLGSGSQQSATDAMDPTYISNLVVSGSLNEYLQKQPTSATTPAILYWLAVVDREMTHSFFYSLADMYLKECLLKFPESAVANRCYKEYEKQMILGYTGSAGTNIPQEVLEDLKSLKSFVDSKGKLPLKRNAP